MNAPSRPDPDVVRPDSEGSPEVPPQEGVPLLPSPLLKGGTSVDQPPVPDPLTAETAEDGSEDEKARKKRKRKAKRKRKERLEFRKADPWQRYKALMDALKDSQDLVDLADHKARFALMIMGALNASMLIVGTRPEVLARVPEHLMSWLYAYSGIYVVIAIYFVLQAIESLRPRRHPPLPGKSLVSEREESLGLRFFAEAIRYDGPTYQAAWRSVRVSQLNAEISGQLHTLARINSAKYAAVSRLYLGLQTITVLTAGLLVALGSMAWVDFRAAAVASEASDAQVKTKLKSGNPKKGGWAILGEPERFGIPGVLEPSGIVFSPTRGHFFVVGDEGSLVEVGREGTVIAKIPTGGNLEDVAEHLPSGRLVLLSEKKGELVVLDAATGKKTGRFQLDQLALLGEVGPDKNQGFEGLAFRQDASRPGGGIFYLVHQRTPAMLVMVAFDPLRPSGIVGLEALVSRTPMPDREDLTAVTYDAVLDRLFVIADSKDRLLMLKASGEEEAEIVLPGVQQEGLSFDPDGNLWIADDQAGLMVFRGARARIAAQMKAPDPEKPPKV